MTILKEKSSKKRVSSHRLALVGVFCLLGIFGGVIGNQIVRAKGRILPNISVGSINVGNLTPEQAKEKLVNALRVMNITGLSFSHRDRVLSVKANEKTGGVETPILSYDIDGLIGKAYEFGHAGNTWDLLTSNVRALFTQVIFPARAQLNRHDLKEQMVAKFGSFERGAQDADVEISRIKHVEPSETGSASGSPVITEVISYEYVAAVTPESEGASFDYDEAIEKAAEGLSRWQGREIQLALKTQPPTLTAQQVSPMRKSITDILERGPIGLAYDDLKWQIEPEILMEALTVKPGADGSIAIGIRDGSLDAIIDTAAEHVENEAKPTKMRLENDRAVDFQGGSVGKRINRQATMAQVDKLLPEASTTLIPIVVDTFYSPDSDPIAEELGLRELIGFGTSNFAGSPTNRRKNIANGARLLDGLIVKPGEEMGLLDRLKPFDDANGYLQELVIKGKRTIPEYGGGLCQIGTTTFRAVMGAGLPVTERQNHSFRVRYYEPAGTDATLYEPAPDFKFVNDTQNHVVLITKVIKDVLRFEFWGTRDGRVQEQSKIRLWDVKPPPEAKLIETSTLKEGEKKCFEKPTPGAKTSFTYKITYPDGQAKSREFLSVYKPWQEQCLIGKAGAPRIVLQKDGAIKELPPLPASAEPGNPEAAALPQ
jgi:vancomycin resistance protein YoaR